MTNSGYALHLQQGAGKYEDSEESDFSQESAKSLAKERSLPKKKQSTQKWNKNCQQPNFKYVLLINGS